MALSSIEKAKICIDLMKEKRNSFNIRRQIEWRVNFTLLCLLLSQLIFINFVKTLKIEDNLFFLNIVMLLIYTFGWTAGSWLANEKDKRYATYLMQRAEKFIGLRELILEYKEPHYFQFLKDWSRLSQVLFFLTLTIFINCKLR